MTTVIWSTESVDTSALLLSQALDDVIFNKDPLVDGAANNDVVMSIRDPNNKVIFYGAVALPEWMRDIYDRNRMFNDPSMATLFSNGKLERAFLEAQVTLDNQKATEVTALLNGIRATAYKKLLRDTTYAAVRRVFPEGKLSLVLPTGMLAVNDFETEAEYNARRNNAKYCCKYIDASTKIRLYLGLTDVIRENTHGIIGCSYTELRRLSFRETLCFGCSADVRNHINRQFDEGILTEDMGAGRTQVGWTEEAFLQRNVPDSIADKCHAISSVVHTLFFDRGVDFCAVDISIDTANVAHITNVTLSPSLSMDPVLELVSSYYAELLENGRGVSKDRLIRMIDAFTTTQLAEAVNLLRRGGLLQNNIHV